MTQLGHRKGNGLIEITQNQRRNPTIYSGETFLTIKDPCTCLTELTLKKEKKEEIWLGPMTKAPTPTKNAKSNVTTQKEERKHIHLYYCHNHFLLIHSIYVYIVHFTSYLSFEQTFALRCFKPQSDIHCNRSATSPRPKFKTIAEVAEESQLGFAVGRRLVGDWSATNRGLVADWSATSWGPLCDLMQLVADRSGTGPRLVADQSPIGRQPSQLKIVKKEKNIDNIF